MVEDGDEDGVEDEEQGRRSPIESAKLFGFGKPSMMCPEDVVDIALREQNSVSRGQC